MNKDMHIHSIRKNLGITLKTISDFINENKNEIENIDAIFSLKGENKKKLLALLYLFASGENDDVVQKYRSKTGLHEAIYNSTSGQITQYNTMLIAALMFNPEFYAMAANYYGAISAGFPVGDIEEDSVPVPSQAYDSDEIKSYCNNEGLLIVTLTIYKSTDKPTYTIKFPRLTTGQKRNAADVTNEDFNAMISDYTKKIEANPKDNNARIMRGLLYFKNGEYVNALKDLQAVSEMNPRGMEGVYYAMGKSYYEIGENDKAIEAFEKIKAINPEFADVNEILTLLKS